jgi:hypothetical protein
VSRNNSGYRDNSRYEARGSDLEAAIAVPGGMTKGITELSRTDLLNLAEVRFDRNRVRFDPEYGCGLHTAEHGLASNQTPAVPV